MSKNKICLWFDKDAVAAAHFYAATFPDSHVGGIFRAPTDFPGGKAGTVPVSYTHLDVYKIQAVDGVKRGGISTVIVTAIEEGGVEVEYNGAKSFIRRSDLSRERADQRPERFSVGDKIDVRVTNIDPKTRRMGLSIKAREIAEEKEAVEQYGSSDSGASLGDILGAARKADRN